MNVELTRGFVAVVDDEDAAKVQALTWYTVKKEGRTTYAMAFVPGEKGKRIYLHRLILDAPSGVEVDHIDRDGLNCRKSNLRLCSGSQNSANRLARRKRNPYRGVAPKNDCARWEAYLKHNGKRRYLGLFRTPEEAAIAYNTAAKEVFGEYAILNQVGGCR